MLFSGFMVGIIVMEVVAGIGGGSWGCVYRWQLPGKFKIDESPSLNTPCELRFNFSLVIKFYVASLDFFRGFIIILLLLDSMFIKTKSENNLFTLIYFDIYKNYNFFYVSLDYSNRQ